MDDVIRERIEKHKSPCLIGEVTTNNCDVIGCSKKGGFPDTSDEFEWPSYNGKHLSFIAQIESKYFFKDDSQGLLLFFWNEKSWGGSIKDDGAFVVIYQSGELRRQNHLPSTEHKILGLFKFTHKPSVWKEESLEFSNGFSLPETEKLDYDWKDDLDDLYYQEVDKMGGFFQIGGFPYTIQGGHLEKMSAEIRERGTEDSWRLLLQVDSKSDMMWGDAGKLYWLINNDDFEKRDFSKIWMIMDCY